MDLATLQGRIARNRYTFDIKELIAVQERQMAAEAAAADLTVLNDARSNGTTQEVAAMSEESASAAEELAGQSAHLSGTVSTFELGEGAEAAHSA